MIFSTLVAATVAAQPAPTPELNSSPAPAAEKKMACCEMMAKGESCCCCKGKSTESPVEAGEESGSDDAKGHAH
ncbi:MAG: hypothetical protein U0975_08330 [Erythrobacter sp.]|nr:hypothetical protein [Erythrobacter sp.]MDZ4272664.1 hypothetical protein [Erythrobacter sp.]